jgi:hypothetical protein
MPKACPFWSFIGRGLRIEKGSLFSEYASSKPKSYVFTLG